MRDIIFRAKRKDNGEWVYGYYVETLRYNSLHWIWDGKKYINVIPETIGQYTSLTDKNGKKIFEGDIVKTDKGKIYETKMQKGCWIVWSDTAKMTYDKWDFLNTFAPTVEVIGNITDNPELMKGGG